VFVTKIDSPDTSTRAEIEHALNIRVRQVGRAETKLVVKGKKAKVVLKICKA
jgi:hypothetical protein